MKNQIVLSLCDYTGIFVKPWLDDGYTCILIDPQHKKTGKVEENLYTINKTIEDALPALSKIIRENKIAFVAGFPVCTDLAVSGAAHFESKRDKDMHFQAKAMQLVHECRLIGELSGAPYFFENPVSVISSIYRKPDYTFDPSDFGGYLPENDEHPEYPDYIAPRDAYPKKTCLWAGGGFVMPDKKPVYCKPGFSDQHKKLGGKSERTKNIRSATPRGFSFAVKISNCKFIDKTAVTP